MENRDIESYDEEIDLFEYIDLFWQKKWIIILITNVSCIVSLVYAFYVADEIFEAKTSLIALKSAGGGRLSALRSMVPQGLGFNLPMSQGEEDLNRFINLLSSRTMTEEVAKELNLLQKLYPDLSNAERNRPETYERMIKSMRSNLVSITDNKKGLLVIAASTTSAQLSADIANTYVEQLQSYLAENTATESRRNRIFIEEQYRKSTDSLAKIDKDLQRFKEENNIFSLKAQSEGLVSQIGILDGMLTAKEIELAILDNVNVAKDNPKRRALIYEIQALRQKIQDLNKGNDNSSDALSVSLTAIPKIERELKNLMREQIKQETLYALLAQQYEQTKIEEAGDEISLVILDPAIPPVRKSKPNRRLLLLLGGVIGLMLSFGLVITLNLVEKYKDEQPI